MISVSTATPSVLSAAQQIVEAVRRDGDPAFVYLLNVYDAALLKAAEPALAAAPVTSQEESVPSVGMAGDWRYISLQSKVRNLLHLLSFADIKTPSESDAPEAIKIMASLRDFINKEGSIPQAQAAPAPATSLLATVLGEDFIEHDHPMFGGGYFCTPDVFAKLEALSATSLLASVRVMKNGLAAFAYSPEVVLIPYRAADDRSLHLVIQHADGRTNFAIEGKSATALWKQLDAMALVAAGYPASALTTSLLASEPASDSLVRDLAQRLSSATRASEYSDLNWFVGRDDVLAGRAALATSPAAPEPAVAGFVLSMNEATVICNTERVRMSAVRSVEAAVLRKIAATPSPAAETVGARKP